jgi:hypothetical protein
MRTWTKLLTALLTAALLTSSVRSADPELSVKRVADLEDAVRQLKRDVERLQKDVTDISVRGLGAARDLQDIKEMLRGLNASQAVVTRQSGYNPLSLNPAIPPVAMPTTGTVFLENVYSAPASVRINDRVYRVEPNQSRAITEVPVGNFQYSVEVDGYGVVNPLQNDRLPPTGYRIRIFPRMPL